MSTELDLTKPVALFRAPVSRGLSKSNESPVDLGGGKFSAGLIRGISVITRGEALGHGLYIDKVMLGQVAEGVAGSAEMGIKSRFAHPDMSGDGIGKMTGKVFGGSVVGDQVFADLHMLQSAHDAPDGDLAGYVMNLAKEAPEDFGTSIAFSRDTVAEDAFLQKHMVEVDAVDYRGDPVKRKVFRSPDPDNKKNYRHARLMELRAVDVVDEPAANPSGLFHRGGAFDVLERGDAILEFALGLTDETPDVSGLGIDAARLRGFVQRFAQSRGLNLQTKEKSMSVGTTQTNDVAVKAPATEAAPVAAASTTETTQASAAKPVTGTGTESAKETPKVIEQSAGTLAQPLKPEVDLSAAAIERCADITAACNMAGKPDLAVGYIRDKNQTVSTVLASLQAGYIAERKATPNAATVTDQAKPKDPAADLAAEYDTNPDLYAQMGLSKEDYVKGGLLELRQAKPAVKKPMELASV